MVAPMSAMMPETWFCARNSAARLRSSNGKIDEKKESNEKNTDVPMQARNITHSTALRAIIRAPWT